MKKICLFLLIFSLLNLLSPNEGLSQSVIKIGALIPYTGRWGDDGKECAKGMLDAAKSINQRNGIAGKKIELIIMDDEASHVAESIASYRKLNETDHILLLYIYHPETALTLAPHFNYDQIPTFMNSLPPALADPVKYPYAFSITPTPLDLAKIGMHFILEKSGTKIKNPKIVFMKSSNDEDRNFLDEAKKYAGKMGIDVRPDILVPDVLQSGNEQTPLLPSLIAEINSTRPDFVYLSLPSKEVASVLEEVKKTDLKTRWLCDKRAFDENLISFEGVLGVVPVSPFGEDIPGMARITEAHQKWHPHDTHASVYVEGWTTIQVISEALQKSLSGKEFSSERIKQTLEGFKDFVTGGLVPPITFTAKDHRPSVESRVFWIENGKIIRHTSFISLER